MNVEELYKIIKDQKLVNLEEVLKAVELSESTIRRRLKAMEQIGLIKLKRGGIIKLISEPNISVSDEFRYEKNQVSKVKIAKKAAELVEEDDIIFIDNGTTVRYMLKYLVDKNVTIYTNGYHHIEVAQKYNLTLNLIPGEVMPSEASIIGESALMYLSTINFDKSFVGANGLTKKNGITTPNRSEANLKRQALLSAIDAYILIDQSKFGLISKCKIADENEFGIISD